MGRHEYSWSREADATLTQYWNDTRLSAAEIGYRMGKTKNAIVGRAHRLDLPLRRVSYTPRKQAVRAIILEQAPKRPKKAPLPPKAPPAPKPEVLSDEERDRRREMAWLPLPGTRPVTMADLEPGMCKWPTGEGSPFLFCGAACSGSYCTYHERMSAGTGTSFERSALVMAEHAVKVERNGTKIDRMKEALGV